MFARPSKIDPNVRYGREMDRTFTQLVIPLLNQNASFGRKSKKTTQNGDHRDESHPAYESEAYDEELDSPMTQKTTFSNTSNRTGDSLSYSLNVHDTSHIPHACARRMYRVVAYKDDPETGKMTLFDALDGRVYNIGAGFANRISNNVVLFDTEKGALSERYPYNQVGATKSGNGLQPRVLIAFDAWGKVRRRHGGAPSLQVEHAKAMKILNFLDPPHPVPKRLCDRYVEPFFFTPADKTPPNRLRSKKHFKLNRFFTLHRGDDDDKVKRPESPHEPPRSGHTNNQEDEVIDDNFLEIIGNYSSQQPRADSGPAIPPKKALKKKSGKKSTKKVTPKI